MIHLTTTDEIKILELKITCMATAIQANYQMNATLAERIWDSRKVLTKLKQEKHDADIAYYLRKGRFPK